MHAEPSAHTADQIAPNHPTTWSTGLLTLAEAAHPGTAASSATTITSTHIVFCRFIP
jgi:hypothetical protein